MAEPAAAISGVGYTALSDDSGKGVLSLAREACAAAIADAGLEPSELDGVASFMLNDDSVPCLAVATALGLGDLRLVLDLSLGGQAPCHLVSLAAQAVRCNQAKHVVVFRAMNGRSGVRVGAMHFAGGGGPYRYPIGYEAYMMYIAMWARRYLHETGQGEQELAAVVLAQREYALRNERAIRRKPIALKKFKKAYLSDSHLSMGSNLSEDN